MVRVRRVDWPYLFVTAAQSRLSTWKDHSSRAEQMKRITYPKKEKRKPSFTNLNSIIAIAEREWTLTRATGIRLQFENDDRSQTILHG